MFGPKRRLKIGSAFLASGFCLATLFRLAHHPGLVWYTTPPLGDAGHRLKVLVPAGWEATKISPTIFTKGKFKMAWCRLAPVERRPMFLQRLFPTNDGDSDLAVAIFAGPSLQITGSGKEELLSPNISIRSLKLPEAGWYAYVYYMRLNKSAFNRTHRQICNSLTIE